MKKLALTLLIGVVIGVLATRYFCQQESVCEKYLNSYKFKFTEAMATDTETLQAVIQEYKDNMPDGCEDYLK